jgi:hypothetical protein
MMCVIAYLNDDVLDIEESLGFDYKQTCLRLYGVPFAKWYGTIRNITMKEFGIINE